MAGILGSKGLVVARAFTNQIGVDLLIGWKKGNRSLVK